MIDAQSWMKQLQGWLEPVFKERLLFLGLQGSYERGEAGEKSDIDVVAVVEDLSFEDLVSYKEAIARMPHGELACGFITGREELCRWPRYELFQLKQGTLPVVGSLDSLLPPVDKEDILESVRINTANLYHEVCHRYLYSAQGAEGLRGSYKTAFFILQNLYYLRCGAYIRTRRELTERLTGSAREIMERSGRWDALAGERARDPENWFSLMLRWCGEVLRELD